jgi:hypothetical protein
MESGHCRDRRRSAVLLSGRTSRCATRHNRVLSSNCTPGNGIVDLVAHNVITETTSPADGYQRDRMAIPVRCRQARRSAQNDAQYRGCPRRDGVGPMFMHRRASGELPQLLQVGNPHSAWTTWALDCRPRERTSRPRPLLMPLRAVASGRSGSTCCRDLPIPDGRHSDQLSIRSCRISCASLAWCARTTAGYWRDGNLDQ